MASKVMLRVLPVLCLLIISPVPGGPQEASLSLEKSTNGFDADLPPGPTLQAGGLVTWVYIVTNTGGVELGEIVLEDDQEAAVHCPRAELMPGESMACTAQGTAIAGAYRNEATVTAQPAEGDPLSASDVSHYLGLEAVNPAIDIEKSTNGEDADTEPGPILPVNAPLLWEFRVSNSGDVPLFEVTVSDDQGVPVLCPKGTLAPGEMMSCFGEGSATAGQYSNLGTASGRSAGGQVASDSDPSHYLGIAGLAPAIKVEKSTNGEDADTAPGPLLTVGQTVNWRYLVTNTGGSAFLEVEVSDDQGVEVLCPNAVLQPTQSMTCVGQGMAQAGQYRNEATATGRTAFGFAASDSDVSHYFGQTVDPAAIRLEKSTNGQDADQPPGPTLQTGDPVNWIYLVINSGGETLQEISVSDDQGVEVTCPQDALPPGEAMACSGRGVAVEGEYSNLGTVTARTAGGIQVSDEDASHYTGTPLPPQGLQPLYFPQFGDGSGLRSEIVISNPSGADIAQGSVELYGAAGNLLDLRDRLAATANVLVSAGQITYQIEPLASARIVTDGQSEELVAGSALVIPSNRTVGGVIRFDLENAGVAGVGAARALRRGLVPVQRFGGINTGLAVRNTTQETVTVNLTLYDLEGLPVPDGIRSIALVPNQREALFLDQIFPAADSEEFLGTLVFEADRPVAVLALELGSQPGQFTTLPVTELEGEDP